MNIYLYTDCSDHCTDKTRIFLEATEFSILSFSPYLLQYTPGESLRCALDDRFTLSVWLVGIYPSDYAVQHVQSLGQGATPNPNNLLSTGSKPLLSFFSRHELEGADFAAGQLPGRSCSLRSGDETSPPASPTLPSEAEQGTKS